MSKCLYRLVINTLMSYFPALLNFLTQLITAPLQCTCTCMSYKMWETSREKNPLYTIDEHGFTTVFTKDPFEQLIYFCVVRYAPLLFLFCFLIVLYYCLKFMVLFNDISLPLKCNVHLFWKRAIQYSF